MKPSEPLVVRIIIGDSRSMAELGDSSVHLVVTSPPYWQLKDYGVPGQIGYYDSYEEYITGLNRVWQECYRVLHPGCRLCVNIGDQFARSVIYGRYKVIPIREQIVRFCESIGFDYMGAIIWQKPTTTNTTGGATVMGSFPYPRNGIVKIDYEFILILKKLGAAPKVSQEQKELSRLSQQEWNEYFSGHWNFPGERQDKHLAMFPGELPKRLIKMFTFVGETVLDPFLGSGTTALSAYRLGRNAVGYEINPDFLPIIKKKLGIGTQGQSLFPEAKVRFKIEFQKPQEPSTSENNTQPISPQSKTTNSLQRISDPKHFSFGSVVDVHGTGRKRENFYRVQAVLGPNKLQLHTGLVVRLIGVRPFHDGHEAEQTATEFLKKLVLQQRVQLHFDERKHDGEGALLAYVVSENRTFINAKIIREGYATFDGSESFSRAKHLRQCQEEAKTLRKGLWAMLKKIENDAPRRVGS